MTTDTYIAITGASTGIGRAAAQQFAAAGHNLILVARNTDALKTVRSDILATYPDLKIQVRSYDLTNMAQARALYYSLSDFNIDCWINNAGFGDYKLISDQDVNKATRMIQLNVEALTLLSMLYVKDHEQIPGTQLINVSSVGGYLMVPTCVTYSATKFYVGAFTENLALELRHKGAALKAKLFSPAATETDFGKVANDVDTYDYDAAFGDSYFTSEQSATYLLQLFHDDDHIVGAIDRETFAFKLSQNVFPYAGDSGRNQVIE
ncbi:SDR family NAD(P)-dependent oxidoreductase [Secundilactobacillus paracollinoides]|uniref:SDR family NAD(P)-dependent oxidoreductase n=1 Tax=Secundilactobacillus paracollinoides TaxID=240427 RepID=UPI0006EF1442|nr:SDR family NAD(P)-dependent oxidoreductase [Secundilactobacillus paracollinoides]KRL79256.1 short-chain dehydrogenase [Secundilactobacillus paracollinoides DSM 15502 = JCM 11969]